MRFHRTAIGLALLAASAAFADTTTASKTAPAAAATTTAPATARPGCPQDSSMGDSQLLGEWTGSIEGLAQTVRLQLDTHPQWKGTVKGTIERGASKRPMVGDVADGSVTLEESADGKRITATWLGDVVEGSCAREIRGDYIEGESTAPRPFVLRKTSP
ncbi:MAG: hypothetical protein LBI66_05730 [Burkholderiaceae bacterium]|jgi:hypothetical protein|nr:hypothetical protein [Burkholderiaceae bacterium]